MESFSQARLHRRTLHHHLPLLATSLLAVALLYSTRPYRDVLSRASFATAYPALALLSATLLLGPLRTLGRSRNPVSDDLRRDLGIWAGGLGVLHAVIGQCVHLRGRPWLYYIYGPHPHHSFPLRHDLFGLANHTGAAATLLLFALLATSNDKSLRKLGIPRWKRLQRWNYAIFALTGIHALAYQVTEKQKLPFVAFVAIALLATLTLQITGFFSRRAHIARSRPAPAVS